MTDMLALIAPATSATLLLIALLVWQQKGLPGRRDLAVGLGFGAVYFLYHADSQSFAVLLPLLFLGPLACNRAVCAGFEATGRPLWIDLSLAVTLLTLGALCVGPARLTWAAQALNALILLLFLELPLVIWRGMSDDLVASRRSLRLWVLGTGGVLGLMIATGSIMGHAQLAVTVGAIVTLGLGFVTVALGPRLIEPVQAAPSLSEKPALDPRETLILHRLKDLMRDEALYGDPNLTLSKLAHRLKVPEHRLRRVIHLGTRHKNFSHYLHSYRLRAFKALIDDPAQDAETILSLAMGVGYSSLSAFNRAFKLVEGMTPRDYRTARMAARTANPDASTLNPAEAPRATITA